MDSRTTELFSEDAYLRTTAAEVVGSSENGVVLDRTVFYAAGGGQPGDSGELVLENGSTAAVAATGFVDGVIVHRLGSGEVPPVGARVDARLDWERRYRLMRMHSCLHLLCAAVGEPVTGGQVAEDKGRLDFAIAGDVPTKDILTERLNAWIEGDREVRHSWIDAAELDRRPDLVRTMSVKPPRTGGRVRLVEIEGVDLQACGGTHIKRTGEIGPVDLVKIENKGKQNRRFTVAFRGA